MFWNVLHLLKVLFRWVGKALELKCILVLYKASAAVLTLAEYLSNPDIKGPLKWNVCLGLKRMAENISTAWGGLY